MSSESVQLSEHIDRSAEDVYEYASEPTNLPHWAAGLGDSIENVDGQWFVATPSGRVELLFAERNTFGVIDHEVKLATGEVIYNPIRVTRDGDECEIVFSLRRLPDMSDEGFARDQCLVQADLAELKRILEVAKDA